MFRLLILLLLLLLFLRTPLFPPEQLIMNVDCGNEIVCSKAGRQLFNSSSQTRLTDGLARNQVSMLPGTFQVSHWVQSAGLRL